MRVRRTERRRQKNLRPKLRLRSPATAAIIKLSDVYPPIIQLLPWPVPGGTVKSGVPETEGRAACTRGENKENTKNQNRRGRSTASSRKSGDCTKHPRRRGPRTTLISATTAGLRIWPPATQQKKPAERGRQHCCCQPREGG